MEYNCSVQTTSWCLQPVMPVIYPARQIHGTCHQSGSLLQNRSTAGHFPRKVATSKAVWPYIAWAELAQDLARALRASIIRLPKDWHCPRGRPRQSWLQTVEADLKPLNFSLHTAGQLFSMAECHGNSRAQACHSMMMKACGPSSVSGYTCSCSVAEPSHGLLYTNR